MRIVGHGGASGKADGGGRTEASTKQLTISQGSERVF